MKAYLCMHQTALQATKGFLSRNPIMTKDKWRIRNLENHPLDPGWERSLYCQCHKGMRESSKILKKFRIEPIFIIDAVKISSDQHFIRSMFQITGIRQCPFNHESQLLFRDYFFAPKNKSKVLQVQKLKGLEDYKGTQTKKLDNYYPEKIVAKIQKNYEHVSKGNKPSSIHQKEWKRYLKLHGIKHVCG